MEGSLMEPTHGRAAFLDGMRISKEHLEHLQAYLHLAVVQIREGLGEGKVVHGLKAEPAPGGGLKVGPGLAFDAFGRPLALMEARELTPLFGAAPVLHAVLVHDLRYSQFFKGFPTVITDHVKVELRGTPPPYPDGAVRFAEITPAPSPAVTGAAAALAIMQSGNWYLPPLDHGHSGKFYQDAQSRMRYDGHPMGIAGAMYDSGWIHIDPGGFAELRHGLRGQEFLAQLETRSEHGLISNRGSGRDYWYDLPSDGLAIVRRTRHKEFTLFRLRLWPYGAPGAAIPGPILPIAHAGENRIVEIGEPFRLDGALSRSPSGLPLKKFKWTQLS
jgi:hypothetical protein